MLLHILVGFLIVRSTVSMGKGFSKPVSTFKFTGSVRPGVIGPALNVPSVIKRPDYAKDGKPKNAERRMPWDISPQTMEDIVRMRKAGRIAREVLDEAVRFAAPGVTTADIDRVAHAAVISRDSYPSPLNYHGFPKSCCTSINEIICHGIPDSTVLKDGDIVNIDITIFHDGVHGDCSETVFIGNVSPEVGRIVLIAFADFFYTSKKVRDLVVTTFEAWKASIAICKPGVRYSEIGGVIEDIIKPKGYTSVEEFCGHGIGRVFHTSPNVLHYKNNQRLGIMEPGHTFTIEPMICLGSNRPVTWPDAWTAATSDGRQTAQFEHTLLITEDGVEELTGKIDSSPKYAWEV